MPRPSMLRLLLGLTGLVLLGVGLINMLALGFIDLLWLAFWLGLGLLLHDGVLAPGTAALGAFTAGRWPAKRRRGLLIALVCIGSLTLIAVPMVLQQDAVAGNSSLLGRDYLPGWGIACLLIIAGAVLAQVIGRVRTRRGARQSTAQH